MDIEKKLSKKLLQQDFPEAFSARLDEYKQLAELYARMENSIAVLSDMKSNVSYIYYGKVAEKLGLSRSGNFTVIPSIWEKEIFSRIHPDDLAGKHLRELQFFHFIEGIPEKDRTDYYISSQIRMQNAEGRYMTVTHRMFYVACHSNGSIRLALCLYNLSAQELPVRHSIIHSTDGTLIPLDEGECPTLLSEREKAILRLIRKGEKSRDIARTLSISINTVSRHRQNILSKLRVNNSVEAVHLAHELGVI